MKEAEVELKEETTDSEQEETFEQCWKWCREENKQSCKERKKGATTKKNSLNEWEVVKKDVEEKCKRNQRR